MCEVILLYSDEKFNGSEESFLKHVMGRNGFKAVENTIAVCPFKFFKNVRIGKDSGSAELIRPKGQGNRFIALLCFTLGGWNLAVGNFGNRFSKVITRAIIQEETVYYSLLYY